MKTGVGQFSCGTRKCEEARGLASYEVPFKYQEGGTAKMALVKVCATPPI